MFQATKHWTGSLGIWGASAGAAALLVRPYLFQAHLYLALTVNQFLSVTPLVRREVLEKVPIVCIVFIGNVTPFSDPLSAVGFILSGQDSSFRQTILDLFNVCL